MMDYDSDISTKVVRVNRTYNVYRGTSPSTQNRLEVSAVCPPLSPAVDYCHLCFCKRKPIVFWKQHLFAAFLNLHLPLFNKSFSVSFYAFSYLCLLPGSVLGIARLKYFDRSINLLLWYRKIAITWKKC